MKICLDAGHYGKYNQSPCNKAYYESDMVWKLHLMLKNYLEKYGIEVVTTRATQETDRELYSRGAASAGCNLFLSLHSNAVGNGINNSVDYPVAYCAINGSADAIGTILTKCVEDVMQTRQLSQVEHRKGQHGDYYGVIRGATAVGTPGLILEHSFHTNSKATEWLLKDANLDRLAKAEADMIAQYYGITNQPESKPEAFAKFPYQVRVKIPDLNIRKGSGINHQTGGITGIGTFTIVEEADGPISSTGKIGKWGLLKSYQENRDGWICLALGTDVTETI